MCRCGGENVTKFYLMIPDTINIETCLFPTGVDAPVIILELSEKAVTSGPRGGLQILNTSVPPIT